MKKFFVSLLLLSMFIAGGVPVQAQDGAQIPGFPSTEAYQAALQDLGARLGTTVTFPQTTFSYIIATTSDRALGCNLAVSYGFSSETIPPASAYVFEIDYNGQTYQYRVARPANIGMIVVPCSQGLFDGGAQQPQQPAPPASGTCTVTRSAESYANARMAPTTDALRVSFICPNETVAASARNADASWILTERGWVFAEVVTLSGDCAALPQSDFQAAPGGGSCPPMAARLTPGGTGRVIPGNTLSLRTLPGGEAAGSSHLADVPQGAVFSVRSGPICDEQAGLAWWEINYNNQSGWIAQGIAICGEYWVEPVTTASAPETTTTTTLPAARTAVTTANVSNLTSLATIAPLSDGQPYYDVTWAKDGSGIAVSNYDQSQIISLPNMETLHEGLPPAYKLRYDGRTLTMLTVSQEADTTPKLTQQDMTNNTITILSEDADATNDLALSPDGNMLAVARGGVMAPSGNNAVLVIDSQFSASEIPQEDPVLAVAFSGDSSLLASRDVEAVRIWNTADNSAFFTLDLDQEMTLYGDVAFHEKILAYTDGHVVRMVDLGQQTPVLWSVESPDPGLFAAVISLSPDGSLIAVTSRRGEGDTAEPGAMVSIYAVDGGQRLLDIENGVWAGFSPDGTLLMVRNKQGGIDLYGIR